MQVELAISNRSDERAVDARSNALRFSLSLTLMLVFCSGATQAQSNLTSKPASSSATTAATTTTTEQTRSRRVAPDAPATSSNSMTSNDAAQGDSESSVDDPPLMIGSDRLSALRVQIEAAKTDNERGRLQRMLIDYLVALGKKSEAIAELRVMSRADRLDPIGFYNIGNALARLGDTDTAIDAYRKAIKQRHGNYARAFNNLGVMFLRQGRWDEAQEALATALRLENFRYSEASYNLGRVYAARGEADLAIREWSRALMVAPDHTDAAIALARAYAEDGSAERGVAVLDSFVKRHGPSTEIMDARREILFGDGGGGDAREESVARSVEPERNAARPVKATSVNAPVASRNSVSLTAVDTSSNNNSRKSVKEKSTGTKRAAASLRPLSVDRESYQELQRARASREGGRNEEAAKSYRRVLSRNNGFFPPANLELSFVLSDLQRHEEAAETLATVAKREGARYPIAYYHLGRQYEKIGRLSLAAEAFEKAAAAYGDTNPQFLLDLSRVREKEGNAQAALTAMESYVRISQSLGRTLDWADERLAHLRQKVKQN